MTDVELDARVTALEENGGGNGVNGKRYVTSNFADISFPNRIQRLTQNYRY